MHFLKRGFRNRTCSILGQVFLRGDRHEDGPCAMKVREHGSTRAAKPAPCAAERGLIRQILDVLNLFIPSNAMVLLEGFDDALERPRVGVVDMHARLTQRLNLILDGFTVGLQGLHPRRDLTDAFLPRE